MALIEYWRVKCIKQHAFSGKMREVGDEYDMKPKFAKLMMQKGEVVRIDDTPQVSTVKKIVTKRRKK